MKMISILRKVFHFFGVVLSGARLNFDFWFVGWIKGNFGKDQSEGSDNKLLILFL